MVVLIRLDGDVARRVLNFLHPIEILHSRCVSSQAIFHQAGEDEILWKSLLQRDFHVSDASSLPRGSIQGGSMPLRNVYGVWYRVACAFGLDPPLHCYQRVHWRFLDFWQRLKGWTAHKAPQVKRTLQAGYRDDGSTLSASCPLAYGLWIVCDGQSGITVHTRYNGIFVRGTQRYHGMFGGYSAYDHTVNLHFLPLSTGRQVTENLRNEFPDLQELLPNGIVFAASCVSAMPSKKFLLVDVVDGNVFCMRIRRRRAQRSRVFLQRCVSSAVDTVLGQPLLKWLEVWMQRLEDGIYQVAPIRPEYGVETRGICLFPQKGPYCSVAVTKGVEVKASAIYMPENSDGWTYSVRLRLVGSPEDRGFETCQLLRRHWVIQGDNEEAEHVDGDGVIGFFPILNDQGWIADESSDPHGEYGRGQCPTPFTYQSISGPFRHALQGTFRGEMTFVPGTKTHPTGDCFRVQLAPFLLHVPDMIF